MISENPNPEIIPGECFTGYAADPAVRNAASSGGIVSALLLDLLSGGKIDAAVLSCFGSDPADGLITGRCVAARSAEEILACGGSSYIETPVETTLRAIPDGEKVAVVALPCQLRRLRRLLDRDPEMAGKCVLLIGLFCRGNVSREFYRQLLPRFGFRADAVDSLRVRRGKIDGGVEIKYCDGRSARLPFFKLNCYRSLGFRQRRECLWCDEHLAAAADIAVGDIFDKAHKKLPIKHSAIIPYTAAGTAALESLSRAGKCRLELFGLKNYLVTFAGVERFYSETASRIAAAKFAGVAVPERSVIRRGKFRPGAFLAWRMILLFREPGNWQLRLPPAAVKLLCISMKILSRF